MSGARDEILARIRTATSDVPIRSATSDVPASAVARDASVARSYRRRHEATREQLVELFAERVADYRASVHRVGRASVADVLAELCEARGATRIVAPADLPDDWMPSSGVEVIADERLDHAQLDGVDGVVTGCAVAIAETGTVVLDGGPRQGRRAISLLPDYHLCVVEADQVVGGLPEAVSILAAGVRSSGRPVTFISGPSATSDIELDRVEGVHGPRTLEVLIVG